MFDQERFEKQLAFIREIDKEKMIKRQSYITDCETRENDADHAWHMAIMTVLLSEYSNEKRLWPLTRYTACFLKTRVNT